MQNPPIPDVGKPYVPLTPGRIRAMERRPLKETLGLIAVYGQRLRERGVTTVYIHPITRSKKGYPTESQVNACSAVLLEEVMNAGRYRRSGFIEEYAGERLSWCLAEARERGIEVVEYEEEEAQASG